MAPWRCQRGSAPAAFLLLLVLLAVSAGLLDIYSLATARAWADKVCLEAAMQAASAGRDLAAYVQTGQIRIDPSTAEQEALAVVQERLLERGLSSYQVQVEVLETGGSVPGFPPLPGASILGADFASPDPAVGVYLVVAVPTSFMRSLGLGAYTNVHAFAASSLSAQSH